jgi:hypothetical protein
VSIWSEYGYGRHFSHPLPPLGSPHPLAPRPTEGRRGTAASVPPPRPCDVCGCRGARRCAQQGQPPSPRPASPGGEREPRQVFPPLALGWERGQGGERCAQQGQYIFHWVLLL